MSVWVLLRFGRGLVRNWPFWYDTWRFVTLRVVFVTVFGYGIRAAGNVVACGDCFISRGDIFLFWIVPYSGAVHC